MAGGKIVHHAAPEGVRRQLRKAGHGQICGTRDQHHFFAGAGGGGYGGVVVEAVNVGGHDRGGGVLRVQRILRGGVFGGNGRGGGSGGRVICQLRRDFRNSGGGRRGRSRGGDAVEIIATLLRKQVHQRGNIDRKRGNVEIEIHGFFRKPGIFRAGVAHGQDAGDAFAVVISAGDHQLHRVFSGFESGGLRRGEPEHDPAAVGRRFPGKIAPAHLQRKPVVHGLYKRSAGAHRQRHLQRVALECCNRKSFCHSDGPFS